MKLQLDQLVEEEDHDEVVLAEKEALLSYRENADLSYKLNIPRDVNGLVELLEERKGLMVKDKIFEPFATYLGTLFGFIGGYIGSLATIFYLGNKYGSMGTLEFSELLAIFKPMVLGVVIGYTVGKNKDNKRKKRIQEKNEEKNEENKRKLQPIEQKLTHYDRDYRANDIVLIKDDYFGISLGYVYKEKDELLLHRKYWKNKIKGRQKVEDEDPIDPEKILCVLASNYLLSGDDVRALDNKTPVVCRGRDIFEYGFVRNVGGKEFELYLDANSKFLSYKCNFEDIDNEEITARLLVPEIKQRIK